MSFAKIHSECSFETLNLLANCDFITASSIGFTVGPKTDDPLVRTVFGRIELHYPCDGHIKANVRVSLPPQFSDRKLLQSIVDDLFKAMGIANDETFYALYTSAVDPLKIGILNSEDRYGRSSMFVD